ncbi:type II secretion system F family protein [uncultured Pigmentiphaga sp.]|uniref:type II secretion system F family protein n=1 Tax=uncultured Pigmentiphaga sp. TaxID=340361 RepID=UPI0026259DC7|nr:type II secretion system F family protein [uncultured Pigmentiphaga sp.]
MFTLIYDALDWLDGLNKRMQFGRAKRLAFYKALRSYHRGGQRKLTALQLVRDTHERHAPWYARVVNKIASVRWRAREPIMRPVIARVADDALAAPGLLLGRSLQEWLPQTERDLLLAGEVSGKVADAYDTLIQYLGRQKSTWQKLMTALFYPLVLVVGVFVLLRTQGVAMLELMDGDDMSRLSTQTMILLWVSFQARDYWQLYVGGLGALTVASFVSLPIWRGRLRTLFDHFAIWRLYRLIQGCTFLISYSMMIRAGLPVRTALVLMRNSARPWLRERIEYLIYQGVDKGLNIGQALRRAGFGFPDPKMLPIIETHAEQSNAAELIGVEAQERLDDLEASIKFMADIANLVMFLIVFGVLLIYLNASEEIINSRIAR